MEVGDQCWLGELRATLIKFLTESKVAVKNHSIGGSEKAEGPGERLSLLGSYLQKLKEHLPQSKNQVLALIGAGMLSIGVFKNGE